jgi:hypothetical protein
MTMKLSRRWWRLKKDIRHWYGGWLVRWGIKNPFGNCPKCGKKLRYSVEQGTREGGDGMVSVHIKHGVECPKCGWARQDENA